jgi:hypothetical protein
MGSFPAETRVLAPGRWARSPHPPVVDGDRGQHDAALEDLQDRAAAEAVLVKRGGGECEPLTKSATAGHGCLLLE